MVVSLVKGEKVDLTKTNAGLNNLTVGLGWDVNKFDNGETFDLDASAFLVGENGKVRSDSDFIFFGNKVSENGAVVAGPDNRTGEGEGDDEKITVDLSKIPADISKIEFTVTIYKDPSKTNNQNFGMVDSAYIRVVNNATNEELVRYDLTEDQSTQDSLVFAELYRNGSEWKFAAIGAGYEGGLSKLCQSFGVNI